ncbi:hypothetical protein TRV_02855 [Trichophyton verrucosum HKI 0517]|uniref:Uncharacterized protein n=1 Tax=Trichophyton verrucosum (strain HKI 0517) TaxID=663202 RepID=D4D6X7_TRIVH|nr:uncharacterized protein TRV_02855 [Trichophyton verrucosum HKI 0517]EFE42415.1 hypothetical protein TRV_02855 [Trichophyton verrucosum HKI 0517]
MAFMAAAIVRGGCLETFEDRKQADLGAIQTACWQSGAKEQRCVLGCSNLVVLWMFCLCWTTVVALNQKKKLRLPDRPFHRYHQTPWEKGKCEKETKENEGNK